MPASECTATVIGLGQIGGSLALALKKAGFLKQVGGYDVQADRLAKAGTFLDFSCRDISEAFLRSDLIILAAPVQQNMAILAHGLSDAPHLLYTDVSSTKQAIITHSQALGVRRFIPGHPLTGSEKPGDSGWNDALFIKKPYFWIPQDEQYAEDVALIVAMIKAIGAIPRPVDPERHDQMLAVTSHLPLLIAAGFMETIASHDPTIADFVAGGFRSTARLAGGAPEMAKDLILTNKSQILAAAADFTNRLDQLCEDIRGGREDAILTTLELCQKAYLQLIQTQKGDPP